MKAMLNDPYPRFRVSDIRTTFEMIDVTAADDAAVVVENESAISKADQLTNGVQMMSKKLATLEHNIFILDGTMESPTTDNGEVGYMSEGISGGLGHISDKIEFVFTLPHSSAGFTFRFDDRTGNVARDFDIIAYDGADDIVAQGGVRENTRADVVLELPAYGYKRIEIIILRTSIPSRRVRLVEVIFGIIYTYGRGYQNLAATEIIYETSLISKTLPSGQLSVTINNKDRKYNMVNADGIFRYLQRGQKLKVEMGIGKDYGELEYVNAGTYYSTRSEAKDDALTAEIVGNDKIMFLDKGKYRRGVNEEGELSEVLQDILANTGVELDIDPIISSRMVRRAIPIVTPREAVRLVVQAAMCVCYMSRENKLVVRDLPDDEPAVQIISKNMYVPVNVEVGDYFNVAEITAHKLFAQNEKRIIYEGEIDVNGTVQRWIEHVAMANPSVTINNGTLQDAEHYLYASKLTITGSGFVDIQIEGYALETSETIYRAEDIPEGEEEQIYTLNNPLIGGTTAEEWAQWVLECVQRRLLYPVFERGNPGMEILDVVLIEDPYGENRAAVIEKQEFFFDAGVLNAYTTGRGI
jgi:hypothetical protein